MLLRICSLCQLKSKYAYREAYFIVGIKKHRAWRVAFNRKMNAIYLFIVNRGRAWFSLAWFLWSFSPSLLIAQTKFSSLFSQDELTPMERKLLRDAEDGRFDALTLLGAYAIITGHRSTADFNHITRGYLNGKQQVIKNVSGKNSYAQSKSLLSQIHEKFLKKYSLNAIFLGELLNEGRYNCISSSLIFADCLDTLNIPRQFMVVSEHIYLNVKADGKTYPCEPTNPHGFDPGEHHLFETPEGKTRMGAKNSLSKFPPLYRYRIYRNVDSRQAGSPS